MESELEKNIQIVNGHNVLNARRNYEKVEEKVFCSTEYESCHSKDTSE